jgi:hypothetical protein
MTHHLGLFQSEFRREELHLALRLRRLLNDVLQSQQHGH